MKVTLYRTVRRLRTDVSAVRDRTDREILELLSAHGRMSWQELGPRVHLSPNAVAERVRRLEQTGVIAGYAAIVDLASLGLQLEAMVDVRARTEADRGALEEWLNDEVAVVDAVHLTGRYDYAAHVRCRDAAELDDLLMRMKSDAGIAETETRLVLRRLGS